MNALEIRYVWIDVQSSVGYNYQYPNTVSAYMREQYGRPSVYRWMVWTPTSLSALYIGETDDLARRVQHCLSPGKRQATNLRLKAYFGEALGRGERVELQTFTFEPFQINNVNFSMDLLGHTHIRRMFENLVLVWLHSDASSGPPLILNRVLTRDMERSKKLTDAACAELRKLGLTDKQTKQVIQALQVTRTRSQ
jgi:hypothetical protein